LPACSTIKGWFPDKERDYQFTTEIPELIIPEDLRLNAGLAALTPAQKAPVNAQASQAVPESAAETVGTGKTEADAPYHAPSQGVSSLQIDQARRQAARLVGKAMTRQKIEIVERNIDDGFFYIRYAPVVAKFTDENLFDELRFIFGDDPSEEQEYRIVIRQTGPEQSEVTVEDASGNVLSNAVANSLLKMITDGIAQPDEAAEPATGQEEQPPAPKPGS